MNLLRAIQFSLYLFHAGVVASSSSDTTSISPVKHLEPSLAASTAHSTIVAIKCDDCVILVSRSPKEEMSALMPIETVTKSQNVEGFKVIAYTGKRWLRLTPTTVCTMTGLTADSQHLFGVLRRQVESHQALYSEPHPVQTTIRYLANIMQRSAQREGSRPFGVQSLMVGRDVAGWQTYTVDPTGMWLHFGSGATAIGRHADKVKEELNEALKNKQIVTGKDGLSLALGSILKGSSKSNEKVDEDDYEALLIWMDKQGCCQMAKITPESVKECYEQCLKELPS